MKVFVGAALAGVLAVAAACLYLARQTAALRSSHDALVRERTGLKAGLAQNATPTPGALPDPQILMRILEQSQRDLTAELSAVLSPQEYETLFPPVPGQGPAPENRDNPNDHRRVVK